MSVTVYGTVVEMEAVWPPDYTPPVVEEGQPPPPEPPKTWVHVHVRLDAPHTGELQMDAPESGVSSLLTMGGRARVIVASN